MIRSLVNEFISGIKVERVDLFFTAFKDFFKGLLHWKLKNCVFRIQRWCCHDPEAAVEAAGGGGRPGPELPEERGLGCVPEGPEGRAVGQVLHPDLVQGETLPDHPGNFQENHQKEVFLCDRGNSIGLQ